MVFQDWGGGFIMATLIPHAGESYKGGFPQQLQERTQSHEPQALMLTGHEEVKLVGQHNVFGASHYRPRHAYVVLEILRDGAHLTADLYPARAPSGAVPRSCATPPDCQFGGRVRSVRPEPLQQGIRCRSR